MKRLGEEGLIRRAEALPQVFFDFARGSEALEVIALVGRIAQFEVDNPITEATIIDGGKTNRLPARRAADRDHLDMRCKARDDRLAGWARKAGTDHVFRGTRCAGTAQKKADFAETAIQAC